MFTTGSSSSFITKLTVIIATAFIINTILLVGINAKSVHKESIVRKIVDMGKVHNLPAAEHNNEDSIPFNQ
ncbi:preprotein translocase SecG subunit [Ehrlichia japonica]|uniref:Preprotein translocase SecG subunit n=2 Tax=Ehrlichia japonica TaxID=391036 RepID=X5GJ94_9RICK|nr:preprotein translocase SecG subunit [Ehrlichia japonica]